MKCLGSVLFLLISVQAIGARETSYATLREYEKTTGKKITEFKEAPVLKTRVSAGELPPVEDRIPSEPLVLMPIEQIGEYGGVWRDVGLGVRDIYSPWYTVREPLIRWSRDFTSFVPNVAKGWKVSEDTRSFTFYLREGMKWSDGAPFTARDFVFWYEDIVLNDEITPVKPGWLNAGGKMGKLERVEDHTIRFTFTAPYGTFLDLQHRLSVPAAPKHYLKRFHPKYTPLEEIRKEMKKEGFDRWVDLFNYKTTGYLYLTQPNFSIPRTPQVTAWVAQTTVDQPVFTMARNPYYWKIDTAGNQLPYIDRIERVLVPSLEGLLLKIMAGEFTHHFYRIGDTQKHFPILVENQKKGDYRLIRKKGRGGTNRSTIFLNFHHKDPVLRKLFLDKRFRIALSIAINREEINDLLFDREALVSQFSSGSGGGLPFWDEKLGKVYTEYDPERAKKLLDEIGLTKHDRHGYRLRPDGKRLMLVNSVFTPWPEENVEIQEMVRQYWKRIGLQVTAKPVSRDLWMTRVKAAQHDMASYAACFGIQGQPPTERPEFFPYDNTCYFAPLWGLWFNSGGKEGEEPPQAVKELMEIYKKIKAEPSLEKRNALARKAFAIHAENLWMIGILTPNMKYLYRLAKNDLKNESGEVSDFFYISSQFFIKQ